MALVAAPAAAAVNPYASLLERLRQHAPALRREDATARAARLRRLETWIRTNREAIREAHFADFRKPIVETDITEIWASLSEIKHTLDHLAAWMRPRRVAAPLALLGTSGWVQVEPKGVCLIIAPWNYPFYLSITPLVSALAAGNCCVLKPSELTPHVAALLGRMVAEVFQPEEVSLVEGDKDVATALLALPFDHIFFTGSPQVGKVVMRAAAEHLTSVTLELGGKSPALVDETADLRDAAEKIVWGKFMNAGQTCVAPDYVLVQEAVHDGLVRELEQAIARAFGANPAQPSESLARVINQGHHRRLMGLLHEAREAGAEVITGAVAHEAECYLAPTLLTNVAADTRLMQEEIFGPILPVLRYRTLMQAVDFVNDRPRPLAQYLFTRSRDHQQYVLSHITAGGVGVNEVVLHLAHPELPFGGIGNSGVGKAHGKYGFLAFSNEKAVLKQRIGRTGMKLMYPPYTAKVRRLVDWLMKYL